ncbi:hypothetical protein ACFQ60_00035 [Streptomyces zhihengii]
MGRSSLHNRRGPATARKHALAIASTLLDDYWHPDTEETLADSLAAHGIAPALMRRRAGKFLTALPRLTPHRPVTGAAARSVLRAQFPPSTNRPAPPKILSLAAKELDQPIGSLVGMPQADSDSTPAAGMRSSTVHQAKEAKPTRSSSTYPSPRASPNCCRHGPTH